MTRLTSHTSFRRPVLTPLLDGKLVAYSTAAAAAGVGLVALAQPAEAKIVYTAANVTIVENAGPVNLDLNNDGTADFAISYGGGVAAARHPEGAFAYSLAIFPAETANQVWGIKSTKGVECAAALPPGVKVGTGAAFQKGYLPMWSVAGSYTRGGTEHCPWNDKQRGAFLGLKFVVNGETHYGWAHVTVGTTTVLNGYAYETVPNQPIETGKTSGPVAVLDSATPLGPRPASLGMLAQGSRGLSIWRRSEDEA